MSNTQHHNNTRSRGNTVLVEKYWSKTDSWDTEKNFYRFPPIQSRSCKLIFGEYDETRKDWCEYWTIEKYLKERIPFDRCLSICCGFGELERSLSRLGAAKKIIGTDIAPGAIEKAREKAKKEKLKNIEYYVSDLNVAELPELEYDLIWANGALHHIRELEDVIPKLKKAMKPGGYLISIEYVGPRYQQLGRRQNEIINAVKHLLPPELRNSTPVPQPEIIPARHDVRSFILKVLRWSKEIISKGSRDLAPDIYCQIYQQPSLEYYLNTDPSECISSDRILPLLKQNFSSIEVKPYHGSILCYALDPTFYENYDPQNTQHRKILDLLFSIEDGIIALGELQSDNVHIICRKNEKCY